MVADWRCAVDSLTLVNDIISLLTLIQFTQKLMLAIKYSLFVYKHCENG